MKLTCVTAVFNAIKSGNRENLIRCVRSVAPRVALASRLPSVGGYSLKTEHEHLIYDGGSTDGTVELNIPLLTRLGQSRPRGGGESGARECAAEVPLVDGVMKKWYNMGK